MPWIGTEKVLASAASTGVKRLRLDRRPLDSEKMLPENEMSFHVDSSDERRAIISYLKQNSGK